MDEQTRDAGGLGRRTLLTLAMTAPAFAAHAGAASTDLAEAVAAYDRATVGNDTEALGALVSEDFVLVNSDASVQGKASYLADFHAPGFRIDPYEMEQPLQLVWGDAALTGGLLPLSWTQAGERHSRRLRIAHVWIRQAGRWRLAYTQLTRVPE